MSECPCKPILNIIPKCDPALNIHPECPVTLNVVETQRGAPGKDATINGVNALEIKATDGITGTTEGKTFTISGQELQGDITAETNRATNAEGVLQDNITAEETRANEAETTLQTNITAEENRAKGVEQQLSSSIDSNHQAISNHVSDKNNPHEVTKAQVGLGSVENIAPADMPLSTATKTYVDNADTVLQGQINTINTTIGGYGNIVTHNVSEFATASQGALADTALQPNDNISELTNNLNYQTATQVANSIAVETNNRESADNNLQSQIDAIVSASDVFDIVGTYAELQAYDISTVPVNDIIKVLEDSTHGGAATYYRCIENNNVKSWSYIGSEGASYTKAEADNRFVPQTRTVNNKALSSNIALTATDVGALPSSTVIPTVNDATVTIQKNGSTVSTFTLNQSSNETVNLTVPTKTSDIANDSGFITSADLPTNYVTTDTAQDIDAVKTFLGEKAIHFKQKAATNKLGFTLYNVSNSELGAFECRPNTISGGALLNVNVPYTSSDWVGFRYWGTAVNVIAPKVATAGNYYIPVNFTDGNTTVTASSNGTVNLSSLVGSGLQNTATGTDSLTILGTPTTEDYSTNIGIDSGVTVEGGVALGYSANTTWGVAIGYYSSNVASVSIGYNSESRSALGVAVGNYTEVDSNFFGGIAIGGEAQAGGTELGGEYGISIGYSSRARASYSIQLGAWGINTEANSFYVSTSRNNNWKMLDDTGLIPDARISSNIARTSAIPSAYGAGLSYSSSSLQLLDQNGNNLGSAVTIKSTPDLDGVTIDTNSDDELEAIGTVNKNTAVGATAVKYDWIGTLAEYNSQNVETLHPEWVCYITDDVSGGTSVYTKAEVDSAISTALTAMLDSAFPVGSRYITEASTCPLATLIPNSTWVLTSQGRVLQGADSNHASGTTAEAGLPNITGRATYISSDGINQSDYPDSGAFGWGNYNYTQKTQVVSGTSKRDLRFDASNSNSIYGNSTTVQPPAEFVNIFKRTA